MTGFGLAVRSILRSWRVNRLRLAATLLALGLSATLVGSLLAVQRSVTRAVTVAGSVDVGDADVLVTGRSGAGLGEPTGDAVRRILPDAEVVEVLRADTLLGSSAQPAQVVGTDLVDAGVTVGRPLARRHDVRAGSTLRISTPDGWRNVRVDRVSDLDVNDGHVVVTDLATAQGLFDRSGQIDALLVTTERPSAAIAALDEELGGHALAQPPEDFVPPELGAFATVRSVLNLVTGVGLVGAILVLAVVWRRVMQDEHDRFAALRLVGVDRRALAAASLVVLGLLAIGGSTVGVVGSLAAGRALRPLVADLVAATGVAAPDLDRVDAAPLWGAVAVTVLGGVVVWLLTIRSVLSISPIDALRGRAEQATSGRGKRLLVACAVATGVLTLGAAAAGAGTAPIGLGAGLAAAALVPAALAGPVGGVLHRRRAIGALAAGSEIRRHPGRSSLLSGLTGLAVVLPLVMLTLATNFRDEVDASIRAWARSGGYVTAGPAGTALRDQRIGEDAVRRIAATPGVGEVRPFVTTSIYRDDGTVLLVWGWDTRSGTPDVRLRVRDGPADPETLWTRLDAGDVAISRQVAVRDGLAVGDPFRWPGRDRLHLARVAAVFDDAETDAGMVVTSRATIRSLTGEDRAYDAAFDFDGTRAPDAVLADIRGDLGPDFPNLVATDADGIRTDILAAVDRLLTVLQALAWATVAMIATVVAVVVNGARRDRSRSSGTWQLAGLSRRGVLVASGIEIGALAAGAAVAGTIIARVVAGHGFTMLEQATGIEIRPSLAPAQVLGVLLGTLLAVVGGVVIPARSVRRRSLVVTLETADV